MCSQVRFAVCFLCIFLAQDSPALSYPILTHCIYACKMVCITQFLFHIPAKIVNRR